MSTTATIGIGLALLAVLFVVGRARGASFVLLRPWFTGFWALATAVNLYVSVAFLGQSFAGRLPYFLLTAAVPVAAAYLLPWLLARKRGAREP